MRSVLSFIAVKRFKPRRFRRDCSRTGTLRWQCTDTLLELGKNIVYWTYGSTTNGMSVEIVAFVWRRVPRKMCHVTRLMNRFTNRYPQVRVSRRHFYLSRRSVIHCRRPSDVSAMFRRKIRRHSPGRAVPLWARNVHRVCALWFLFEKTDLNVNTLNESVKTTLDRYRPFLHPTRPLSASAKTTSRQPTPSTR